MRLGKKIWSILLTMVMVFAMMVPAMAETTDPTTVTIKGTGNEFSAWQLLTATEGNNNNFAYELNSKAITTADSMLDTANNLKR